MWSLFMCLKFLLFMRINACNVMYACDVPMDNLYTICSIAVYCILDRVLVRRVSIYVLLGFTIPPTQLHTFFCSEIF